MRHTSAALTAASTNVGSRIAKSESPKIRMLMVTGISSAVPP